MTKIRPSITLALLEARESFMTYFRPSLQEVGLTEQQWRVIRILGQDGELESTLLAEKSCILKPSLTGIIRRLCDMNLLERQRSDIDQRFVLIRLTEAGKEIFEVMSAKTETCYQEISKKIDDEKLDQLFELIKEIKKIKVT